LDDGQLLINQLLLFTGVFLVDRPESSRRFFVQLHSFFDHFLALCMHVCSQQLHISFRIQFPALRRILHSLLLGSQSIIAATIIALRGIIIPASCDSFASRLDGFPHG
jgi:hypothetical protein